MINMLWGIKYNVTLFLLLRFTNLVSAWLWLRMEGEKWAGNHSSYSHLNQRPPSLHIPTSILLFFPLNPFQACLGDQNYSLHCVRAYPKKHAIGTYIRAYTIWDFFEGTCVEYYAEQKIPKCVSSLVICAERESFNDFLSKNCPQYLDVWAISLVSLGMTRLDGGIDCISISILSCI